MRKKLRSLKGLATRPSDLTYEKVTFNSRSSRRSGDSLSSWSRCPHRHRNRAASNCHQPGSGLLPSSRRGGAQSSTPALDTRGCRAAGTSSPSSSRLCACTQAGLSGEGKLLEQRTSRALHLSRTLALIPNFQPPNQRGRGSRAPAFFFKSGHSEKLTVPCCSPSRTCGCVPRTYARAASNR